MKRHYALPCLQRRLAGGTLSKRKIIERTLGDLVVVLAEETKRFICNKRDSHQFNSDVFTHLVISAQRNVDPIEN
jgi:hypothetical protein